MSIIKQIQMFGFQINWTFLSIGYYGFLTISSQITSNDVCQYALEVLEKMNSGYELVAQLVAAENDEYEFNEIMGQLVKSENVDLNIQERKWRVYLVDQELKKISKDFFNGLLELTDLWVSLDLPNDCPHVIQGRNNTYSPQEYYTQTMYDILVKKNMDWVKNEITFINSEEKNI